MDAQRFDAVAKAMASGSTRRQALRLAGGGLAGALLAAAGLGKRAGAQEENTKHCDDLRARCIADATECAGETEFFHRCLERSDAPSCHAYFQACPDNCNMGERGCLGCTEGQFCTGLVNPSNRLVCRCVSL